MTRTIFDKEKPMRILSIEGGGIRGLIPAMFLVRLEEITGRHSTELFDLFIGTSTGAMISAIINAPSTLVTDYCSPYQKDENCNWKYTAKDLVDVYIKEGPVVFEYSMWKVFITVSGLLGCRYYTLNRDNRFKAWIGDMRLKDTIKDVIITSYDRCKEGTVLFNSTHAKKKELDDFLMTDCVKAATAAPTIWGDHVIDDVLYMDALHAKDPSLFGIAEAVSSFDAKLDNITILCLGTGNFRKPKTISEVLSSGISYLSQIFGEFINANTESTKYLTKALLKGKSKVLCLNPELSREHDGVCDVSKCNIDYLVETTKAYIKEHDDEIVAFAEKLLDRSQWRQTHSQENGA